MLYKVIVNYDETANLYMVRINNAQTNTHVMLTFFTGPEAQARTLPNALIKALGGSRNDVVSFSAPPGWYF